jgi:hypothetical protein
MTHDTLYHRFGPYSLNIGFGGKFYLAYYIGISENTAV